MLNGSVESSDAKASLREDNVEPQRDASEFFKTRRSLESPIESQVEEKRCSLLKLLCLYLPMSDITMPMHGHEGHRKFSSILSKICALIMISLIVLFAVSRYNKLGTLDDLKNLQKAAKAK